MSATRTLRILALCVVAAGVAQPGTITTSEGNITVTSAVTRVGALYEYNYTVTDATADLAVLDIAVTPGTMITGRNSPGGVGGFTTAYDSGLGLVSFLANSAAFTKTPESGFIFDSPVAPAATTFGITLYSGLTGSGSIQAPTVAATPEPASLAFCALGGAALFFRRKSYVSESASKQEIAQ